MSRIDEAIANAAFVLDTLMAYRQIVESGDCNDCLVKDLCKFAPKPGELVRYNCPYFERKEK